MAAGGKKRKMEIWGRKRKEGENCIKKRGKGLRKATFWNII